MHRWNWAYLIITAMIMISLSAVMLIAPDQRFSSEENRYLAQLPVPSWDAIRSGAFGEKLEQYVADQIPLREQWVTVKAWLEIGLNKKENNGVYTGKDGYLLQKLPEPSIPLEQQMAYINSFTEHVGIPVFFLLAPNSAEILAEKLPKYASAPDQKAYIAQAYELLNKKSRPIQVYDSLSNHKNQYIYYRTDHHWTSLGAYYAYRALADQSGWKPLEQAEFDIDRVSENFFGTLTARSKYRHVKPDAIDLWLPADEFSYKVTHIDDGTTTNSLYDLEKLSARDQYPVFLGGNHALTVIETPEAPAKTLLVVKDSYAHSLVPFLTNHYREIHMADLRYLNISVSDYAKQIGADEVLLLYNVATFQEDEQLVKLKW